MAPTAAVSLLFAVGTGAHKKRTFEPDINAELGGARSLRRSAQASAATSLAGQVVAPVLMNTQVVASDELTNASVMGRLLEEISWEGKNVRAYRNGGRGEENVLTAEVFSALSYLPRAHFLGEVLRSAQGAVAACAGVASQIEDAELVLLPDEARLPGRLVVQPDATLSSANHFVLVEAKGMGRSSFQSEQLAREYVTAVVEARGRVPLLLLVLGSPPPVSVQGAGRVDPVEAVTLHLDSVLGRVGGVAGDAQDLVALLPQALAWVTWSQIHEVVTAQAATYSGRGDGLDGTIRRLAASVTTAIDWHK